MSEMYNAIIERRKKLDLENPNLITTVKETELDKSQGTTEKMRAYCRKHGLSGIKDLNIIWGKQKINYMFKVKKEIDAL